MLALNNKDDAAVAGGTTIKPQTLFDIIYLEIMKKTITFVVVKSKERNRCLKSAIFSLSL